MRTAIGLTMIGLIFASCGDSGMSGKLDLAQPPVPDLTSAEADLASARDQSSPTDSSVEADLAMRAPDLSSSTECRIDADCKLYSSYCLENQCVCIPLPKTTPDPTCNLGMGTCFVDPCFMKNVICNPGSGTCMVE